MPPPALMTASDLGRRRLEQESSAWIKHRCM